MQVADPCGIQIVAKRGQTQKHETNIQLYDPDKTIAFFDSDATFHATMYNK